MSRRSPSTINGETYEREVEARKLLVHFIRDDLDLTGTHVGCDTGNCGACTVLLDGEAVKSCMLLAAQADGATITTVEGLAPGRGADAAAAAFSEHHGLQCGYCTPGMLLERDRTCSSRTRARPRTRSAGRIQGNICRCTGYVNIVRPIEPRPRDRPVSRNDRDDHRPRAGRARGRTTPAESIPRKEDGRLVQGQGVFADDVKRHGMGYVHFVRSPYAHARIVSVDVSARRGARRRLRDADAGRGRRADRSRSSS